MSKLIEFIRSQWIVLLLVVLAVLVRVIGLGSYPASLTPDEVSLGYNAYSILQTGKDEYGRWFPILFESFGDNKPGLYIYLAVPSVWLLGLNEFSTRLPAALMGGLAVAWLYGIVRLQLPMTWELRVRGWLIAVPVAYFAAFALAFNPYHIWFSRGAWESQVALSMVLFSLWMFFAGLQTGKKLYLWISSVVMAGSFLMYQGAKMSSLLVMILLFVLYGRRAWELWGARVIGVSMVLFLVVSMPVTLSMLTGGASRLGVVSIFGYDYPVGYMTETVFEPTGLKQHDFLAQMFHGEWFWKSWMILERYFNYFGPRFLVIEGDWHHPWTTVPYHGVLYWIELPLLVLGVLASLRTRRRLVYMMFIWLLLAPMSGALTLDPINAVRSMYMIAPVSFFVGYGLWWVLGLFPQTWMKTGMASMFLLVWGISLINYFQLMIYVYPSKNLSYSYYTGFDQMAMAALELSQNNGSAPIVVEPSYAQPHMYFLFYGLIDPAQYQSEGEFELDPGGDVGKARRINDQIHFDGINWSARLEAGNVVLAGRPSEFQLDKLAAEDYDLRRITYPNGVEGYYVVYVKPR